MKGAQIDITSAAGSLVFGIFAARAELEREPIRERTRAGLKAAPGVGSSTPRRPLQAPPFTPSTGAAPEAVLATLSHCRVNVRSPFPRKSKRVIAPAPGSTTPSA